MITNKFPRFLISSVLLIFFTVSQGFADRGLQQLVPAGSPVYDHLFAVCLEQGIINFADNAPLTIEELKFYLKEIDYDSLSESGKSSFDFINSYFNQSGISFKSDLLFLSVEPSFNPEVFYKSNDDIEWVFDRYSRLPLVDFPVTLEAGNFITLSMDLYGGQNKNCGSFSWDNKNDSYTNSNYSNIPRSEDDIDVNFPDDGYFSTGKKLTENTGISFQLGKGERSIGRSLTGSIIWSEYLTGISYGALTLYSPDIRYTANVSQFGVDKYMYYHQWDIRLFRKFTFTALEGMYVNAPLELRYLNPFMIFHGIAPWRDYDPEKYDSESHICAYLGLKFQYIPVRNLRVYGLYAMTQFQTPYETKNNPNDVTPNGIGGQLGTEYNAPAGKGRFHFGIEGSYAQPYLYIKEGPDWTLVKTYAENSGRKRNPFYEWIGSPFGPDTISGEFSAGYQLPSKFSVNLIYLFMARGEMSGTNVFKTMKTSDGNYVWGGTKTEGDSPYYDGSVPHEWCYPEYKNDGTGRMDKDEAKRRQRLVTPTGTPEYVNRISLQGSYFFTQKLEGTIQPSYVIILNRHNVSDKTEQGIEIAAALTYKF